MTAGVAKPFVYLASASPRRRELLTQIGLRWEQLPVSLDERRRPDEAPADYVRRLALAKAGAARVAASASGLAPVVAADTAVVVDEQVLGKPGGEADCARMLGLLSGRVHQVLTAVAVVSRRGETVALSCSEVVFREISEAEMAAYWRTGEPVDKAGSYAIQGVGAIFVREIRGSYSGVMGLPLFETAALLREHGVALLPAGEGQA